MRTRLERKIDHIISMIDHKYSSITYVDFDKKRVNKIAKEISNLEVDELYEFLVKLFSGKHNSEIINRALSNIKLYKK